jgi:hypothetical protein
MVKAPAMVRELLQFLRLEWVYVILGSSFEDIIQSQTTVNTLTTPVINKYIERQHQTLRSIRTQPLEYLEKPYKTARFPDIDSRTDQDSPLPLQHAAVSSNIKRIAPASGKAVAHEEKL